MAQVPVEVDPLAIVEGRAAYDWYRQRSTVAAERLAAELDLAIEAIAQQPLRYPSYIDDTRRFPFRRFPYFVVYRPTTECVQVIAIVHGRRRPGYWRLR
jgi:toxin ParE1/3/4